VGVHGAVATFGALVSDTQRKLLGRSVRIVAAFDNPRIDDAGRKACETFLTSAKKYGMEVTFFNYNGLDVKDVGDMQMQDIQFGLANARDMIFGERAYLV
jgi:DNA primase